MWREIKEILQEYADLFYKHWFIGAFVLTASMVGLNVELFYLYRGEFFYTDTDCYTRALRIVDWLQNFQWQEKIFPYFNPPHGFVLHFTRICDVIWVMFALPLALFMPLKDAVFYGGMFFSPLFMALALAALIWGIKPYLPSIKNKNMLFLGAAIFGWFLLNKINGCFDFSRPDHHSLMCCLSCYALAVMLNYAKRVSFKNLLILGFCCGLGMWASSAIEGLFLVTIMLCILCCNWIFYKHSGLELTFFSLGLFLSVTLAWLINPPFGGFGVIDINRLSIVHVCLTALMFLGFTALNLIKTKRIILKIATLSITALICAAVMLLIFGAENIFTSIYEPQVYKVFIPRIVEMQHINYYDYEAPLIAWSVVLILMLLLQRNLTKMQKCNMVIFFVFATISAAWARRFLPYFSGVTATIATLMMLLLFNKPVKNLRSKIKCGAYIILPLLYLSVFSVMPGQKNFPPLKTPALTDLFYAPQLRFKHNIDSVGGPYHTNVEGITDNYKMWFTADENELKTLLKKHAIKSVYLDAGTISEFYAKPKKNTDKLYGKVMSGENLYPWLKKISDGYYEIDYEKF